uniref:ANK_REP_REGION domain-containing protein n=3 Tax=Macrostomum lignano TaxID=282301 RepID=A0A1I8I5U3_9PLAT
MGQAATKQEAFWECCSYGREWKVRQLLESGGIDVNWVSHVHQSCPIHVASQGKPEIVRLLLSAGCQVDARDSKQHTALHHSAMTGQDEIVQMLLKAGADPSAVDERGWSALIMACYFCQPAVVRCLLDARCDFLHRNNDGRNCLHELCRAAPKSQICQNGKRVSTACLDQANSPVYAAVMAELQAAAAASGNGDSAGNGDGEDALAAVAAAAAAAAARNQQQQKQSAVDAEGDTATHSVSSAPIAPPTSNGPAALPLDRSRFDRTLVDIAECLLSRCPGLSVDDRSQPPRSGARGEADFTPLMFAIYHGHLPLAKCLLDHGADVGAADMSGWTALHWAVNREAKAAVELLISYGANPERKSMRGETPLDLAGEDPEMRQMLAPAYPEIVTNGYVTTDDEGDGESVDGFETRQGHQHQQLANGFTHANNGRDI